MEKIMNLKELKNILKNNQNKQVTFNIDKEKIPQHYHLTEVGKENKVFIDCGGTKRQTEKCVLQLWVANDTHHRLNSEKFLKILNLANDLFEHNIPDVCVEYEKETVSQYPISYFETNDEQIDFYLEKTHTACLAPEKCGVDCCTSPKLIKLK
jgi:hypothetical protein